MQQRAPNLDVCDRGLVKGLSSRALGIRDCFLAGFCNDALEASPWEASKGLLQR